MRLSTALKLAALLAVALVVGLVAAVKSMDFNRTKAYLVEQVRAATGRTLVVAGPLELRLGVVPRVIANGITLANATGGSRPDMVKIDRIEAEVALLPLLKREIRINRLVVTAPDILVETNAKGRGNWVFTPPNQPAVQAAPANGVPAARLTLREVRIKNARLSWRDGRTGSVQTANLHKVAVQPDQNPTGPLSIQIVGDLQSRTFELGGRIGALAAIGSGKPWPVQLKSSFDGMVLVAEGTIADPLAGRGLDLRVNAQGDELGKIARLAGLAGAPPPLGPFKLAAHVVDPAGKPALTDVDVVVGRRDALLVNARGAIKDALGLSGVELNLTVESDNLAGLSRLTGTEVPSMGPLKATAALSGGGAAWKLGDLKATLAGSDVGGELALATAPRPRLSGRLTSGTLSLADFTTPASKPGEKLAPKNVKAGADGFVFSRDPLPFSLLSAADADLSLHVGHLDLNGLRLTDAGATLHLAGGRLALRPLTALLASGQVEGEASIDAAAPVPSTAIRLTTRQVELGRIAKELGNDWLTGGRSDGRIDLQGRGDNLHALMASASGEAVVSVGEGRLNNKAVDWAGGDLMVQMLGALNPLAKSADMTPMSCAALRFTVRDGLAMAAKGLALETAHTTVTGAGTVDLKSEALDIGFTPRAREGIGLSLGSPLAGMTRLRGTLANPSLGIDEVGTARTAASVGAAVATGGLSLLGELLVDKITADQSPCQTALGVAPARKARAKAPAGRK